MMSAIGSGTMIHADDLEAAPAGTADPTGNGRLSPASPGGDTGSDTTQSTSPRTSTVSNWIDHRPGLSDPLGNLRLGMMTFVADGAGGMAGGLSAPTGTWVVTADLDVRLVAPVIDRTVRIDGRTVRAGSTTVVCELGLVDDASGERLGTGSITNHLLATSGARDLSAIPRGVRVRSESPIAPDVSVVDYIGLRPTGESGVELALQADLLNPWGMLHGGFVAVGAEEAVLCNPTSAGRPVLGMLVRYLAPNRVGPIHFVSELVGVGDHGATFTVRSYDRGAAGRLTSLTTVTLGARLAR